MNLGQILAACYADTGYTTSPNSEVTTRFTRWINDGLMEILRYPGLTDLRQGIITADSVASYNYLAMPYGLTRIDNITDTVNNIRLNLMTRDRFRLIDPGETAVGLPTHYIPYGESPVLRQPAVGATAVKPFAVSTNALDITQTVNLIYLQNQVGTGPYGPMTGSAVLTGLTRVALVGQNEVGWILGWNLSATAVGQVEIYDASVSGNLLGRITPGQTAVQYQVMRLWPTPSAAVTYTIEGQLYIQPLSNTTDVPEQLPVEYHNLLVMFGKIREYQRTQDERLAEQRAEFDRSMRQLRAFIMFPADYRPIAGDRRAGINWTNLPGGWYPADGSWP